MDDELGNQVSQAGADVNTWGYNAGGDRNGPGSLLEVSMRDYNSPVEVFCPAISCHHHQSLGHLGASILVGGWSQNQP